MSDRPDVIVIMTDEERAVPPYEAPDVLAWRGRTLTGRKWFLDHDTRAPTPCRSETSRGPTHLAGRRRHGRRG